MKQLCSTYSISGSSVTLTGVNVPLSQILLVSDATTGNVLYSMAGPAATSYTQAASSTITLASTPGSSDKLTIYYDDAVAVTNGPTSVSVSNLPTTQPVSGTVTSARNWNLAASSDSLTAAVSSLPAVSLAGGQTITAALANGSTLSSSISNFPSVQNVSLVGDSLASIPASLTAAVSLASGQNVGVSSLPAISGNVGITSLPSVTVSNPTTGTPTLGAAVSLASGQNVGVSSLPAISGMVSLAGGQTLTAAFANGSTLSASGGDLTSGSQKTQIVSGSNTLAVDSLGATTVNVASNLQYTYLQSGSGSVSSGTILIPTTACSSFRSAGVQIISLGSGASFILKLSLDGGTTFTNQFLNGNVSGSQATSIGINDITVLFGCNLLNATHFQLVQGNAQTAGTSKVIVSLSQQPLSVNNPSVTFPSTSQLTTNKPVSANTTAGGSVSTLAGGATVLGGSSATKSLTVQNNNVSGNMYFNVGANSTATLPQAQCALLTAGQGFTFDVLPSSSQYLFLQSPTSGLTYSLLYA